MGGITEPAEPPLRPPERLTAAHDLTGFTSTEPDLDDWLRKRAFANEGRTARTYVVCAGPRVVGFYALVNGAVQRAVATAKMRRNAPDPVPAMIIGRLAVDKSWERRGIGGGMLRDAVLRTLQASEIAGIGAVLVHAISSPAKRFYLGNGFSASELEPMTLMVRLKDAELALHDVP